MSLGQKKKGWRPRNPSANHNLPRPARGGPPNYFIQMGREKKKGTRRRKGCGSPAPGSNAQLFMKKEKKRKGVKQSCMVVQEKK